MSAYMAKASRLESQTVALACDLRATDDRPELSLLRRSELRDLADRGHAPHMHGDSGVWSEQGPSGIETRCTRRRRPEGDAPCRA